MSSEPPPPTQAGKPSAEAEKILAAERVKVNLQKTAPNEASAGRLILLKLSLRFPPRFPTRPFVVDLF